MKQITDTIKETITKETMMWAYPIMLKLQEHHYNLAIQWAVECWQIYSYEFNPTQGSKFNKYLQQAREKQNVLTALQCDEIGREIWHLPGREEIQTALARVYWSISTFKDGDERVGLMQATWAVELVLPDPSNRSLLNRYLEAALKIYEQYKSQN